MKRYACLFLFLVLSVLALVLASCGLFLGDGGDSTTTAAATTTAPVTTATPAEAFLYEITDMNTVVIGGYLGRRGDIVIPAEIEGFPVTEIGTAAFIYPWCKVTVTSVVLPNGLERIGDFAFEGTAITQIDLPDTLTYIGSRAFAECKELTHITIPSDCLDDKSFEAFVNAGLQTVTLTEGVTEIPETAFAGTKLREVRLPSTVTAVRWQAFAGCEELETVVLNEGLEIVDDMAFYDTAIQEIFIPTTVNCLSKYAFLNASSLHSLRFLGNAPESFLDEESFYATLYPDYIPPFTIYFYEGAKGFTAPEWNGLPSAEVPR